MGGRSMKDVGGANPRNTLGEQLSTLFPRQNLETTTTFLFLLRCGGFGFSFRLSLSLGCGDASCSAGFFNPLVIVVIRAILLSALARVAFLVTNAFGTVLTLTLAFTFSVILISLTSDRPILLIVVSAFAVRVPTWKLARGLSGVKGSSQPSCLRVRKELRDTLPKSRVVWS